MRLSPLWTGRLAAIAAAGLAGVAMWSLGAVAADFLTVRNAEASVPATDSLGPLPDHTPPLPMIRLNDADALRTLITLALERLGMTEVVIDARARTAVGDGVALAELEVRARGSLDSGRAVLNWAAVNRQGARLVSTAAHPDPEGEAAWTFVMQVGGA